MIQFVLLVLFVNGISEVIGQVPACKINNNCDCCNSNPIDGTREPSDICDYNYTTNSPGICKYGCKDGYHGGRCWNRCPVSCTRCAFYFGSSNICYLCADGYYNGTGVTNCSTPCPANCEQKQCDKTTGKCLHGCVNNNWSGGKCNKKCPVNCMDDTCDREDGTCIYGCKVGYYGETCNKTCPDNCLNNVCGQHNGICNNCTVGYYSKSCDLTCSKECILNNCKQETGTCTYQCHCDNAPQSSCYTGEIVGGTIAGFTVITVLLHVVWCLCRRNKNSSIPVTSVYENENEAYDDLHITGH
ncbi:hypothetical protein ACF0H5_024099 [Mactra antiquata]